jgi:polyhydroxybutyrate depolymerase
VAPTFRSADPCHRRAYRGGGSRCDVRVPWKRPPRVETRAHAGNPDPSHRCRRSQPFVPSVRPRFAAPDRASAAGACLSRRRQSCDRYAALHEFDTLANSHGFIVAYPDGIKSHWNDTRRLSPADDVEFVRTLIAQLKRSHHVDEKRVYATGISNGGFFSVRLACDLTREIAAVAAVAATMPETLMPVCKPSAPISIMFMHGTQDPLVRIDGGVVARRNGRSVSLRKAVDFWRRVNHASELPSRTELPDRQTDGTHVRRELYRNADDDVEVVTYTIDGGGHTWPGGVQYLPVSLVGRTSTNLDATETIWAFFSRHHR